MPRPARFLLLAGLLVLLPLTGLLGGAAPAGAEQPAAPVRMLLLTSGLTWEDIDEENTPALQELADQGGLAAMNTTSATERSSMRQGAETVRTGYRGLAAEAPRSAGIPQPATDRLAAIPGGVQEVDASKSVDQDAIRSSLHQDEGLAVIDAGSVDPEHRAASLRGLDHRVARIMAATGEDMPRTILASVAPFPSPDATTARQIEGSDSPVPAVEPLQAVIDTGLPGQALTSGATHQDGVVVLTDVAPTVLASHGLEVPSALPGQPFRGADSGGPQRLALDRTQAATAVTRGEVIALGAWMLPTGLCSLALLIPALARRPRLSRVLRSLGAIAPLALPVGLFASLVPWWRAEVPTLALVGVVVGGSALCSALVLLGPWRRHRCGPAGVSAALVAGGILLESATGSRFQLSSPLGTQPITGGRYYGLTNHLFGMVLAGALMALLCLFTVVTARRTRVLVTLAVGAVLAVVCVAPSMGADFGSALVVLPVFGLLAVLVSGIRVRLWHLLALAAGGAVVGLGISFLDWRRPPADRSHQGRFIDDLLSGQLMSVITRKLAQNVGLVTEYVGLGIVVLLAAVLSVMILAPRRLRLARLAALDVSHPVAHRVRIALVIGGWTGYLVNDTGPVLVAAMLGVWLCLLPVVLPEPAS